MKKNFHTKHKHVLLKFWKHILLVSSIAIVVFGISTFLYLSHSQREFGQTITKRHFPSTVFIGDSLTAGLYATTADKDYKNLLLYQLQKRDPLSGQTSSATAVAGKRVGDILSVFTTDASKIPVNKDLIVVELGTNDVSGHTDLATFQSQYSQLLNLLASKSPNALFVCLGVWQPLTSTTQAGGETYDAPIRSLCNNQHGVYVDITPLNANSSYHGPVGRSTFNGPGDWFHPNDAGHNAIAGLIFNSLTMYIDAPMPTVAVLPKGYFRSSVNASQCNISGWTCQDSTTLNQAPVFPNTVNMYANAPMYHSGSIALGGTVANKDVGSLDLGLITSQSYICGNTTKRYFSFPAPASIRDGKSHTIYGYGIDLNRSRNNDPLLSNTVTATCTDYTAVGHYSSGSSCTTIRGWACQYPGLYNRVDFYDGTGYTHFLGSTMANVDTGDQGLLGITQCGGSTAHYFLFTVPASIKDGKSHSIYAYAIDDKTSRNHNPLIYPSPFALTCTQ